MLRDEKAAELGGVEGRACIQPEDSDFPLSLRDRPLVAQLNWWQSTRNKLALPDADVGAAAGCLLRLAPGLKSWV